MNQSFCLLLLVMNFYIPHNISTLYIPTSDLCSQHFCVCRFPGVYLFNETASYDTDAGNPFIPSSIIC